MKILLESEVVTSKKNFFAYPYHTFNGQNNSTKYLIIPLLQRDYVWPEKGSVSELLLDLYHHVVNLPGNINTHTIHINNSDYYYTGTILCESQKGININSEDLSLVDGQQRMTTIYLMNYLGYLVSRFSLAHMPGGLNETRYALELTERFSNLIKWENRCFVKNYNYLFDDLKNYISKDFNVPIHELTRDFEIRIGLQIQNNQLNTLWDNLTPRLKFNDQSLTESFKNTLQNSELSEIDNKLTFKYSDRELANMYKLGLNQILQHFNDIIDDANPIDQRIEEIHKYLEAYTSYLAMTCIISENENDSFSLFEVLNERGQDLTALDLVKNLLLERSIQNNTINDFENRWSRVKTSVSRLGAKSMAHSNFVNFLIRTEGSTLLYKPIAYLRNRQGILRNAIFVNESNTNFFLRLEKCSEILSLLNANANTKNSKPFDEYKGSCYQYTTFMRMIRYDWGQQVIIGTNLIYLLASNYASGNNGQSNSLHENNNWTTNYTNNRNSPTLNHFLLFLSDIMLKIGIVGIINKKTEDLLPDTSKRILETIIEYCNINTNLWTNSDNLRCLITQIKVISESVLNTNNQNLFIAKVNNDFYADSPTKRNIAKIILYLIYSRSSILTYVDPELEHLEPINSPQPIIAPYYNQGDRLLTINKIGNFILLNKDKNAEFSNLSIIQKLRLARTRYPNYAVFQTNLFKNIDIELNPPVILDLVHGQLPLIKKSIGPFSQPDDSFLEDYTPTRHFFNARTELYANLAARYIFENNKFLSDGSEYIS